MTENASKREWVCSCGQRLAEDGKSASNYMRLMGHIRQGRAKDGPDTHESLGLRDEDDMLICQTLKQAQALGIVPRKNKKRGKAQRPDEEGDDLFANGDAGSEPPPAEDDDDSGKQTPASRAKSPIKGKLTYSQFNLDEVLLVLYNMARAKFPEYRKPFPEWIVDCCVGFYREHPELGLHELLAAHPAIRRVLDEMTESVQHTAADYFQEELV